MTAFYLGPLGRLRPLDLVQRGASAQVGRASSAVVTLGGARHIQRAPAGPRDWSLSLGARRDASQVAHVAACATGALPGPLFLYAGDAARTNLLPSDVAAPGRAGSTALGSVLGSVAVGMPSGVESLTGVVQQASVGAWSPVVPVRASTGYVLSGWSSAAGAAVEWRTVSAAGVPVSSGTLSTVAVGGGFYGAVEVSSGAAAGIQVRLAAGSRTVGGLRLVEGTLPTSGTITRRNLIPNPQISVDTATWTARGGTVASAYWLYMWQGQRGDRVRAGQLTSDGTSEYLGIEQPLTTIPVVGGQWIAVSALIACDHQDNIGCRMDVVCNTPSGATFNVSPGSWQPAPVYAGRRITWAFQAPATTTTFGVRAQMFSGANGTMVPAGRRLWLSDVHAATAATEAEALAQVQTYFDGSTPPEPGRYNTWDGTPHASPSTERVLPDGATFPGWMPGRGVPQVVVDDPAETLQLVTSREVLADYTVTIREVG